MIQEIEFAPDSPQEGDGFEPSVPRHNKLCVAPATGGRREDPASACSAVNALRNTAPLSGKPLSWIRATYQQESGTDIDRYRDALMPRMRKSPPDPSKRETDPESCPPSKVEK